MRLKFEVTPVKSFLAKRLNMNRLTANRVSAKRLLVCAVAAMCWSAAAAYDFAGLDRELSRRYDADSPGAAVIIARGDSVLYERYVGVADMTTRRPVGPDTRFCIASCSKQFTVAALLRAAEQSGQALMDSTVADFFDYPQPFWQDISLRNLASHTSGVPDTRPRSDRNFTLFANEDQSIGYLPSVDTLKFGPGEYYDYLNPSFILLAKAVQKVTGQDFYDYVRRDVFGRAGMDSTYFFNPAAEGPGQSHAYRPDAGGRWREYDYGEETFFATRPDGGIYSTARDLLKWENALRDNAVISAASRDMAYRPHVSVSASPFCDYQQRPDTWYGLGWFVDHPAGKPRKVYHTGDNGGYQAYLAKYPDQDIKIIVLENRHDHDRWQLATLIDRILNLR